LDGDRIAILAAEFIGDLVKEAGIPDLQIGLVQTAYCNGAAKASNGFITQPQNLMSGHTSNQMATEPWCFLSKL
jgi:hypothetical protein